MKFSASCFVQVTLLTLFGASAVDTRSLRPVKITKTTWDECVGMKADECAILVRREARRHAIPGLMVGVVKPRTKAAIQDTYMRVGIAVNVFGEVTGSKNDGMITYPYVWVSAEEGKTRELGPWDCSGLDGWSCCRKVRLSVPDADTNNNHIKCFAHENSLIPVNDFEEAVYEKENLPYYTFAYNKESAQYEERLVPPAEVLALREAKNETIANEIENLDAVVGSETILFEDLIDLNQQLLEETEAVGDAQHLVGDIEDVLEGYSAGDAIPTTEGSSLGDILRAVRHKMYDYSASGRIFEDWIWIYSSHNGRVWRTPQIGGVFDGHDEALKNMPGFEDYELRYASNRTGTGVRYLAWEEVDV